MMPNKPNGLGGRIKGLLQHPMPLTLARIVAVPGIILLMLAPNRLFTFMAAILFAGAAITDFFDGFFARQRGMESNFGKIMDPLADKLLVSSSFNYAHRPRDGCRPGWFVSSLAGKWR